MASATSSADFDILHLPLDQLAILSLRRLKDSKTLERAAKSILYRDKWKAAGIVPAEVNSYDDFSKMPFISSNEMRRAFNENPIEDVLCSDQVVQWLSTTGTTGMPKWIPYTRRDIELFMEIRDRSLKLTPSIQGLKCFAVSNPAPFSENALSAFERIRGMMANTRREGVDICFTHVDEVEAINFALDLKPAFIAAWPSFAARFAEEIGERAPEAARHMFQKHKTVKNFAIYLVTRFKRIRPKDLSKYQWGLFGGEPLDPYREILKRDFGLDAYEMYMLTEFLCPAVECFIHQGMHLWIDTCLPEIIVEAELETEHINKGYTPKAIPLWKAEPGLRGEFVFTSFGEALPLVRYRTGDLMQVVGIERCGCGVTHPRIRIPRRSDATICLGAIRFSAEALEEKLLAATPHGRVQRWQLTVSRDGYRLKPIIKLEPYGDVTDEKSLLEDISSRLKEIKILRTGVENKMVVEPVISIEREIPKKGLAVTPNGLLIYEDDI